VVSRQKLLMLSVDAFYSNMPECLVVHILHISPCQYEVIDTVLRFC